MNMSYTENRYSSTVVKKQLTFKCQETLTFKSLSSAKCYFFIKENERKLNVDLFVQQI